MTERPLLFSAPMVRALRENRKTVTRRTRGLDKINEAPNEWEYLCFEHGYHRFRDRYRLKADIAIRCPYGVAGDRLWTREAWRTSVASDSVRPSLLPLGSPVYYEADCPGYDQKHSFVGKLRPGMFMPRWASRDTLEITSARPERLHAITEADAIAEGCPELHPIGTALGWYAALWDTINGHGEWAKSPWVWRVEFRRVTA